jgi:hypothetical protein
MALQGYLKGDGTQIGFETLAFPSRWREARMLLLA